MSASLVRVDARAHRQARRGRNFARGDHVEVAEALLERLRDAGQVVFDDGALYRYSDERHVFVMVPDAEQSRIVQSFAGIPAGEKKQPLALRRSDVSGAMRLASDLVANPGFFAGAPPGIVFADAFVEVTASGCMQRSHSADHRARFAYPFAFMPNVVPALFVGFLADVFRDDADASDKARLLQEYLGVSLLGIAARYQRALVLFGPGANGKSVLTAIAEASMPPGACCAIPPQDWANEYRLAMLAGKRLNVVAELPEADIMGAEAFKSVISGDPMTGRHIRQAPFTLRPVAGHIFAGNRLPGTNDQTHGFWRRFLVVSFNRTFALHEQTPKLAENLIATELPSIVSWCLEGAARVLAQGSYTIPASSAAAIEKWRKHADQVRAFIDEWTTTLPLDAEMRAWTKASDVYRAYRAWASENGHRPLASNTFGQRMDAIKLGSAHTENGNKYPVRIERPAMRTEGEP